MEIHKIQIKKIVCLVAISIILTHIYALHFDAEIEVKAAGKSLPVALSLEQQYEANIFMSNFAELIIRKFNVDKAGVGEMVNFAVLHAIVNRKSMILFDGTMERMSLQDVNIILLRFFGKSLSDQQIVEYQASGGKEYFFEHGYYSNGYFYWPVGNGESYVGVCIVDRVESYKDGSQRLWYTLYDYDVDEYWKNDWRVPDAIYRMTPSEAASNQYLSRSGSGFADVVPYSYNGRSSYQLKRMKTNKK